MLLTLKFLTDPEIEGADTSVGAAPIVFVSVAELEKLPPFAELFVAVNVNVYVPEEIDLVLPLADGTNGNPVADGLTEIDNVAEGSSFETE